jgi:HAD superfamily hydrolase (TIGR01509 family)
VIKALIFDFDGLVMDTESPAVDGWKMIYAEYGQEFPLLPFIRAVIGISDTKFDTAGYLADKTGKNLDLDALRRRQLAYRLKVQSKLPALPGVNDYIKSAHRLGLRLAMASSSGRERLEGYLRQLGLLDDFDPIICREDVQRIKPAPDLFLKAQQMLKLRSDELLIFEDSQNGILAANRAGIRVVAVPNPITAHDTHDGASLLLNSLANLPLEELLKQFA